LPVAEGRCEHPSTVSFHLWTKKMQTKATKAAKRQTVILLHGLGRTNRSMAIMAYFLRREGYRVINQGYPSRSHSIPFLVDAYVRLVVAAAERSEKIHFVTHSMGGILVRYFLERSRPANLGRVVMLSPPNQGSEIVDLLRDNKLFREIMGPAALQLGIGFDSVPLRLGPVNFELGVIAGSYGYNPFITGLLEGDNDGLVSVRRMRVAGMTDFCVLPFSHTFIMNRRPVIDQVLAFLGEGRFIKQ
jgi:pimeloyl-ACP methyl ester carboxylesterase